MNIPFTNDYPPLFDSEVETIVMFVQESLTYSLPATSDEDDDDVIMTVTGVPAFAEYADGSFTFYPRSGDEGTYSCTIVL